MKILKIEKNQGFVAYDITEAGCKYKPIEQTNKDDILEMLDFLIDCNAEIDHMNDGDLPNPAQSLIYKDLEEQLRAVIENREAIKREVDDHFKIAEEKYKNVLPL